MKIFNIKIFLFFIFVITIDGVCTQKKKNFCSTCYQCLNQNRCANLINHCKSLLRNCFWVAFLRVFMWHIICRMNHIVWIVQYDNFWTDKREPFCCARDRMGVSTGLGLTKTGKHCLTDANFFSQIQFLCPYNSIFNRQAFKTQGFT